MQFIFLSTTEKSKDQRQATHREGGGGRGEGAHDFMQCDKNRATGNYVEEDKNASVHPSPPPLLFLKKGDMSLSVEIAPLTSLLLGGLISLSFPKYKLGSRA